MPVPSKKRPQATKAIEPATNPNSDADNGGDADVSAIDADNLDNELDDEDESGDDQQGEAPLEAPIPAYIPLRERTQLPINLYVKTTYPHGAVIDGVHMPVKSGFHSNDRYLSRLLLDQGVELVEDYRDCDAYHW